jgi:hypothetical protein
VTITHPCHPLHGKQVQVLYICHGPQVQLIVQFPDGLRAYVPLDWTDLTSPQQHDSPADSRHLLDLDGLRQVVQLIDCIRDRTRSDRGTATCPPDAADADERGAYNEADDPSAL